LVVGLPGDEARLAVAEAMGAEALAGSGRWWEAGGYADGSDVVVDASGASATLEPALALARAGGQVVKVGWGPEPYGRPLDALVGKAVELHGSFSHTWSTWERVLRLLGRGRLVPGDAITEFSSARWEDAFRAMAERTTVKAVLSW
jgi:alcohol dehydrogenase/L-iditol 2-dehydrogenase